MHTVEPLLGTRGEVAVSAPSTLAMEQAESAVIDEARRLEKVFTVYDEASDLHAMRRAGATTVAELQTVVSLALEWHQRTNGVFHPALQPLIDVWDHGEATGQVPDLVVLSATTAALAAWQGDHVDVSTINLNGIAKGWIADRALDAAFSHASVTSAWLSLGGDLVHRGDGSLVVGIENPARPYDNVPPMATVEVSNEALATSGGGRRWWEIDGSRYSKVLDPRTGRPADDVHSASVIASTATDADALATTCLVLEAEEALALVTTHAADCFLVCADGTVRSTSNRFRRV